MPPVPADGPIRFRFGRDCLYAFNWAQCGRRTDDDALRPFDRPFTQPSQRRQLGVDSSPRSGTDGRLHPGTSHAFRNVLDVDRGVEVGVRVLRTQATRRALPLEDHAADRAFDPTRYDQALRRVVAEGREAVE